MSRSVSNCREADFHLGETSRHVLFVASPLRRHPSFTAGPVLPAALAVQHPVQQWAAIERRVPTLQAACGAGGGSNRIARTLHTPVALAQRRLATLPPAAAPPQCPDRPGRRGPTALQIGP